MNTMCHRQYVIPGRFLNWFGIILLGMFAPLAPGRPATNSVPVFPAYEGTYAFRIPSLICCPNGTLLAFAEGRRTGTDFGNIDIVMKRSTNNGATWEPLRVIGNYSNIVGPGPDLVVGNPVALVDRTNARVLLLAQTADADETSIQNGLGGSRRVWITDSTDTGLSWSPWREITGSVKPSEWRWFATGPGHGIQLESGSRAGRLLVPVAYTVPTGSNALLYSAACIFSDDGGQSWQLGAVDSATNAPLNANETCVVELTGVTTNESRIYFNTRNQLGSAPGARGATYSFDSGNSFSSPFTSALDFVTSICEGSLLRVTHPGAAGTGGCIVFCAPNSLYARKWLSLWVSRDESASWEFPRRVWAGPSGYSDLTLTADGKIAILFENMANGMLLIKVDPMDLHAPADATEKPNQGLWKFGEFVPGQMTTPGATNILDTSPAGFRLNLVADGVYPFVPGPSGFQPTTALALQESGGLWLYPSVATNGTPFDFGADDSFTIETLVRIPANEMLGCIASKDWQSKTPSWWLRVQEGGYVRFLISDSQGHEPSVRSAQKINDGAWHRIVAVRDATARLLRLYVDGLLSAQATDTTTGSLANGRALTVGRLGFYNSTQNLNGDIDFISITPIAARPEHFLRWPQPLIPLPPDFDHDGEPDIVEYAFHSDSNAPASRPFFMATFTNTVAGVLIRLDYHKVNDSSVNTGYAVSEDLTHWTNALPGLIESSTTLTNLGAYSAVQTFLRDTRTNSANLFLRLAVFP